MFGAVVRGIEGHLLEVKVTFGEGRGKSTSQEVDKELSLVVQQAILRSGYSFPSNVCVDFVGCKPSNYPILALPVALGILAESGQICVRGDVLALGGLTFSGDLTAVRGILPGVRASKEGMRVLVPTCHSQEAMLAEGVDVFCVNTLREACEVLSGKATMPPAVAPKIESGIDWSDIRGLEGAKRVLEIAAAGGHNVLLVGPPGTGKTMLSRRLVTILPEMTKEEILDVSTIYSAAGVFPTEGRIQERPFRAPHHTIGVPGMIGGGVPPRMGEVTLAHDGVLFLDELSEFRGIALDALVGALQHKRVSVGGCVLVEYPADFLLVAAMMPCSCGYGGTVKCTCTFERVVQYWKRISLLWKSFDLYVSLTGNKPDEERGETSSQVQTRVTKARQHKPELLAPKELHAELQAKVQKCTAEGDFPRVLRVAQTIASLDGAAEISFMHLDEAFRYFPTMSTYRWSLDS